MKFTDDFGYNYFSLIASSSRPYDKMAMLRRETLTLSILADRFKLIRNNSAANLSSQTRLMKAILKNQSSRSHQLKI